MADAPEPRDGKSRSRKVAKSPRGNGDSKTKISISLSADALMRLSVHAAMWHKRPSAVIEKLIVEHLRRFVVSDRARDAQAETDPGSE